MSLRCIASLLRHFTRTCICSALVDQAGICGDSRKARRAARSACQRGCRQYGKAWSHLHQAWADSEHQVKRVSCTLYVPWCTARCVCCSIFARQHGQLQVECEQWEYEHNVQGYCCIFFWCSAFHKLHMSAACHFDTTCSSASHLFSLKDDTALCNLLRHSLITLLMHYLCA